MLWTWCALDFTRLYRIWCRHLLEHRHHRGSPVSCGRGTYFTAFTSDITEEFLARRKQETAESRWNSGKEVNANFAELVFYPVHGELREVNQKRAYEEKRSCIYLTELWILIEKGICLSFYYCTFLIDCSTSNSYLGEKKQTKERIWRKWEKTNSENYSLCTEYIIFNPKMQNKRVKFAGEDIAVYYDTKIIFHHPKHALCLNYYFFKIFCRRLLLGLLFTSFKWFSRFNLSQILFADIVFLCRITSDADTFENEVFSYQNM